MSSYKIAFHRYYLIDLHQHILLFSYDLDLDPKTFILDPDLDIMKLCLRTKTEVCRSKHSKVRAQTGQMHIQMRLKINALRTYLIKTTNQ